MREADEPYNLRGRKSRRGGQQVQAHLPPEHLVSFPIFFLRHGHRGQAPQETRPERHPRRAAQGHRQRYHRFQLETQLERPDRPETAARAQATRLRHVAWPGPFKPYHPHRVHGTFRGYWDYDGGGLGDMGQHYLDPVQYIMGKDNESPVEIEADTQKQHHDAVLPWREIRMKYADGTVLILDGENRYKEAAFLEGPNGKLFKGFKSDIPNLDKKLAEFPDPEPMVTDFIEAVRERKKFALNEANGHRSCTLVNLAKISLRTG